MIVTNSKIITGFKAITNFKTIIVEIKAIIIIDDFKIIVKDEWEVSNSKILH